MLNKITLELASVDDQAAIWSIFKDAIAKRKNEGSDQWQNGYPNPEVILEDINNKHAYVARDSNNLIRAYIAIIDDIEPAYEVATVQWLTKEPYTVIHRLAVDQQTPLKGLATWVMKESEKISLQNGRNSIKVDTSFDNIAMLRIFEKLSYIYCGKVILRGGERFAFEKRLKN